MKNKLLGLKTTVITFFEELNDFHIEQIERLTKSDDPDEIAAIQHHFILNSLYEATT